MRTGCCILGDGNAGKVLGDETAATFKWTDPVKGGVWKPATAPVWTVMEPAWIVLGVCHATFGGNSSVGWDWTELKDCSLVWRLMATGGSWTSLVGDESSTWQAPSLSLGADAVCSALVASSSASPPSFWSFWSFWSFSMAAFKASNRFQQSSSCCWLSSQRCRQRSPACSKSFVWCISCRFCFSASWRRFFKSRFSLSNSWLRSRHLSLSSLAAMKSSRNVPSSFRSPLRGSAWYPLAMEFVSYAHGDMGLLAMSRVSALPGLPCPSCALRGVRRLPACIDCICFCVFSADRGRAFCRPGRFWVWLGCNWLDLDVVRGAAAFPSVCATSVGLGNRLNPLAGSFASCKLSCLLSFPSLFSASSSACTSWVFSVPSISISLAWVSWGSRSLGSPRGSHQAGSWGNCGSGMLSVPGLADGPEEPGVPSPSPGRGPLFCSRIGTMPRWRRSWVRSTAYGELAMAKYNARPKCRAQNVILSHCSSWGYRICWLITLLQSNAWLCHEVQWYFLIEHEAAGQSTPSFVKSC